MENSNGSGGFRNYTKWKKTAAAGVDLMAPRLARWKKHWLWNFLLTAVKCFSRGEGLSFISAREKGSSFISARKEGLSFVSNDDSSFLAEKMSWSERWVHLHLERSHSLAFLDLCCPEIRLWAQKQQKQKKSIEKLWDPIFYSNFPSPLLMRGISAACQRVCCCSSLPLLLLFLLVICSDSAFLLFSSALADRRPFSFNSTLNFYIYLLFQPIFPDCRHLSFYFFLIRVGVKDIYQQTKEKKLTNWY